MFFGKVADNNDSMIKDKFFCGEIQRNLRKLKRRQKKWKSLPVLTEFELETVEITVRSNPHVFLEEYYVSVFRMSSVHYEEDQIIDEVWDIIQGLSWEERETVIAKIIKHKKDEIINIAIQENFTRIQMEVRSIIMSECGTTQQIAPSANTDSSDESEKKDDENPAESAEERKAKFVNDAFDDD